MHLADTCGIIQSPAPPTCRPRAAFVIDPEGEIRTILSCPLNTGRNCDETKHAVIALQKTDAGNVATPAERRPDDGVIVPAADSCDTAKACTESQTDEQYCLDWFFCFHKSEQPTCRVRPHGKVPRTVADANTQRKPPPNSMGSYAQTPVKRIREAVGQADRMLEAVLA